MAKDKGKKTKLVEEGGLEPNTSKLEISELGTLEPLIAQLISGLGEDITREGIVKTPHRVEKSMRYLMSGYQQTVEEVVNNALFKSEGSEMIIVKDIEFYSMCEHHMLPFFGKAHIAYIPNKSILGLSKFARITDVFARRMQVQERMTTQIADSLLEVLNPKGVAVVTEAQHLCMMMRGVQKQASTTRTSAVRGIFQKDSKTRQEFFNSID